MNGSFKKELKRKEIFFEVNPVSGGDDDSPFSVVAKTCGDNHPHYVNSKPAFAPNKSKPLSSFPLFKKELKKKEIFFEVNPVSGGDNDSPFSAPVLKALFKKELKRKEVFFNLPFSVVAKTCGDNHPHYVNSKPAFPPNKSKPLSSFPLFKKELKRKEIFFEVNPVSVGDNDSPFSAPVMKALFKKELKRKEVFFNSPFSIVAKTCGDNHPHYVNSKPAFAPNKSKPLSSFPLFKKELKRKEIIFNSHFSIVAKTCGDNHPRYVNSMSAFAPNKSKPLSSFPLF